MTRTAQTTLRLAVATIASVAALSASNAFAAGSQSKLVGETKHWQIVKTIKNGEFDQCAARRKQPGPNKMAVVRREIGWMVQFYNPAWAERDYRKTSARLTVHGRKLALAGKYAVGTSFIFHLGTSDASVDRVAGAKWLTFFTESGRKIGYTVRGISQAVNLVDQCYADATTSARTPVAAAPVAPKTNGGAFGAPTSAPEAKTAQGAFGAPAAAQPPKVAPKKVAKPAAKPSILDKTATMPFAKEYLENVKGYELIADDKGPKGWPVKWQVKSGVMGALVVLKNDPITTRDLLAERIKAERAACKGDFKSQTDLKSSVSIEAGQPATAMYVCQGKTGKQVGSYMVRKISPELTVMILELVDVTQPKVTGPKLVGA